MKLHLRNRLLDTLDDEMKMTLSYTVAKAATENEGVRNRRKAKK